MTEALTIPGPRALPFFGNFRDVDPNKAVQSWVKLAGTYGEIFKLHLGGLHPQVFIASHKLMDEVCNERRFDKSLSGPLKEARNGTGDGLFTAFTAEPNWGIAHRTLQAAFGPVSVNDMYGKMHDVVTQLVMKWARLDPEGKIGVVEDFTRMTLDTIALCAMGARFNSFYTDALHPFVAAMGNLLGESASRASRPSYMNYLLKGKRTQYESDIAFCRKMARETIEIRRQNPTEQRDLLNAMINGKDPKTGLPMTEESMVDNLIKFFSAGHEITAGLLSFLTYFLILEPEVCKKAQAEVDRVVGHAPITLQHINKLPYVAACMRETLRLMLTAPTISFEMRSDSPEDHTYIGGGKYRIAKGQPIVALLPRIHSDPEVYGADARVFNPDRMLDKAFLELPANSWKPFGNGVRGCIGRPFAWQEALLATAMVLQNFNLRFDDPAYQLSIAETLAFKPGGLYIIATLREGIDPMTLERALHGALIPCPKFNKKCIGGISGPSNTPKRPMSILYGSNSGTCEALAQSLARAAGVKGYVVEVNTLDSAVNNLPREEPVIIICASYEGIPPDNAAGFVSWLGTLRGGKTFEGVNYSVFGSGNRDWFATFHKVPKYLNRSLAENGANCFARLGLGDVSAGELFNEFDQWQDEVLWPALAGNKKNLGSEDNLEVYIDRTVRKATLKHEVEEAHVLSNELLTTDDCENSKRHIKFKLPSGMTYSTGQYLAILPHNSMNNIRRVLNRFALPWDAMLTFHEGWNTNLPTGRPISVMDTLGAFVELSQPATKKNIHRIASSINDECERREVLKLAGATLDPESRPASSLDILEAHPSASLSFASFLQMLAPMCVRQYSISCSPLEDPSVASITWSVLDTPSPFMDRYGKPKRFLGVASNFLSSLEAGDCVQVRVKPSQRTFHLPADMESTPLIMVCAGSGIAPFRGFVQERAILHERGAKLAPAYLFIGCMHPKQDVLFVSELERWQADGVVTIFYAFSRSKKDSKGAKYAHERLWEERKEVFELFNKGAKIFVCGSASVGNGVANTVKKIYAEAQKDLGMETTEDQVEEWFKSIKGERYASDVFV